MKRLNPETGKPFLRGFIRENGDIFYQYRKVIRNGYYIEYWLNPESFKKHNFTNRSGQERTSGAIASTLLGHAKGRCLGIPSRIKKGRFATGGIVTITQKWIAEKIERGVCEATGDLLTKKSKQPNSPSLDRIDPNNPDYTPENARIVTWKFNNMKGAFSDEEFIRIAKQLEATKQKSTTPLPDEDYWNGEVHPQYGVIIGTGVG
jgi:hypothetical protein